MPNIIDTVIPITYLWNLTIGGNFKAFKGTVIIYHLVGRFGEFSAKDSNI